jgi:GNAT superfamily N-acetyltransferase
MSGQPCPAELLHERRHRRDAPAVGAAATAEQHGLALMPPRPHMSPRPLLPRRPLPGPSLPAHSFPAHSFRPMTRSAPLFRALTGSAADRALVADLIRRSSAETLRSRFFLPGEPQPEQVLQTHLRFLLAGPPDGLALLALVDGIPAGLLNLVAGPGCRLELGVMVADGAQRRGIAGSMLQHALRPGRWPGWMVRATVQPGNAAARALVRGRGARLVSGLDGEYVFEFPASPPDPVPTSAASGQPMMGDGSGIRRPEEPPTASTAAVRPTLPQPEAARRP